MSADLTIKELNVKIYALAVVHNDSHCYFNTLFVHLMKNQESEEVS